MRVTDDRYARERDQFELAMRMIGHEARTCTIRDCTSLSDDRIRKLYRTYFRQGNRLTVKRRRGKSPRRCEYFVKMPQRQLEATTLALLYTHFELVRPGFGVLNRGHSTRYSVLFGSRFCAAYETYERLHEPAGISFEHAWFLLQAIATGDELVLIDCTRCQGPFLYDALGLKPKLCPCCHAGSWPGQETSSCI